MNKLAPGVLLLLVTACGSSGGSQPVPATDAQVANLQASMTEMLERLDVMNDRITRLEKQSEERQGGLLPAGEGARRADEGQPSPGASRRPLPAGEGSAPAAAAQRSLKSAQLADTYRNAMVLFGKNRFAESRAAFQKVFEADAAGELADNALFWIGETYFATNDFNNAARYYKRVADEYGDQNKAPDALFKLALTYEKTSDLALARTTLQDVIARYPYSAPAASAKSELNRIKY
jgi:tol-pal system protein YbgF